MPPLPWKAICRSLDIAVLHSGRVENQGSELATMSAWRACWSSSIGSRWAGLVSAHWFFAPSVPCRNCRVSARSARCLRQNDANMSACDRLGGRFVRPAAALCSVCDKPGPASPAPSMQAPPRGCFVAFGGRPRARLAWYGHCRKRSMSTQPHPTVHTDLMTASAPASAITSASVPVVAPVSARVSHYEQLGGLARVQTLVDAFYAQMDQRPEAQVIRAMHPADLGPVKAVLVSYLCEWLGGPHDYSAQRGHPRLRMRHQPFAIGDAERDAWLNCMQAALLATEVPAGLRHALMQAFSKTADHLRNRAAGHPVSSNLPRTDHD